MDRRTLTVLLLVLATAGAYLGWQALKPAPEVRTAAPAPDDVDPQNVLVLELAGQVSGAVHILLRPDVAPQHAARLTELARAGAYDGVVFHRVIDGFMAQTGDVEYGRIDALQLANAGRGGSALPNLPAEFSDLHFARGVLGMARSQAPDSANSQFFITFEAAGHLDRQYTVVGRVTEGMELVDQLKRGTGPNGAVIEDPDYIARAYILADETP